LYTGAEPKTIGRGARVKKIKCLSKKKHHFLLHELYFSANQGGVRTPVGTYLGAATGCTVMAHNNHNNNEEK
jgi:hypothetical protein